MNTSAAVNTSARTMVEFLSATLAASDMGGHRGLLDMFADRIAKAASQPTLSLAMESLLRSVNAGIDGIHPPLMAAMAQIANGPDGERLLRWIREQPKIIALFAGTRDQLLIDDALIDFELPTAQVVGIASPRGSYPITLRAQCETPLAHGADGKAGNATLFRRMQVLVEGGAITLPYYAGNALRGQIRDLLADHLLAALGLPIDRAKPAIAMWFFYALYSGGALQENSDATKALKKQLGDGGAIRAMGIREFRSMLPALSLLGCALGNRILPGHVQVADLRPVCHEWGTGDRPVAELMSWEFLTRREDHEDHIEHHGMIANTEVLRAGAELEGGIDHDEHMPAIEIAALARGVELLVRRGRIGAENRRGFGRVRINVDGLPSPAPYDEFLANNKAPILVYLQSIGALGDLIS